MCSKAVFIGVKFVMFLSPAMDRHGTRTVICRVFSSHEELHKAGKIFVIGDCRTSESICSFWGRYTLPLAAAVTRKMLFSLQCLSSVLVSVPVKDVLHEPLKNARRKLLSNYAEGQKKNVKFKSNYNSQTQREESNPTILVGDSIEHSWELHYHTMRFYCALQI